MRYRVKVIDLKDLQKSAPKTAKMASSTRTSSSEESQRQTSASEDLNASLSDEDKYLIQNWQFEIRKLTYEDAGTYTCLLPLVKPITKNVTLQVIRKIKIIRFSLTKKWLECIISILKVPYLKYDFQTYFSKTRRDTLP